MNAKRMFALVMAILLSLGVISPVLSLFIGAATQLELGTATGGADITGVPDSNYFEANTVYQFEVVKDNGVLKVKMCTKGQNMGTDGKVIIPNVPLSSVMGYGGLTFKTFTNEIWAEGNSFQVSVVEAGGTGATIEPGVTLVTTEIPDLITKSKSVPLKFIVVDYNFKSSYVSADTVKASVSYDSSAFPLQGGKSVKAVYSAADETGFPTFEVTIPARYSGKGNNVTFNLSYYDNSGEPHVIKCTSTIPNTREFVDKDDPDDPDDKDPDPLIPYIIVESYTYGGDSVTAGSEFDLELVLRNTSEEHALQNIVMNLSPMGVFSMGSSSNTIYIDKLNAGSTVRQVVTINTGLTKVTDDKDANSIQIKFDYQYLFDKVRKTGTSSENITLPVDFPDRFSLTAPEMSSTVFEGEEMYLYMPMVNKGRSSVYNLTATVKGDMTNPGQTQYIGNLAAGSETGAEFNLRFEGAGEKKGEILVTYEDANMNPKELTMPFSLTVQQMDMGSMDPGMNPGFPDGMEPPSVPSVTEPENDPTKTVMMIVAAIVCAMSAFVTVQKAKAKRSIFADEEL